MMDSKENCDIECSKLQQPPNHNSSKDALAETAAEAEEGGAKVPTLRERMRRLMQLRSAWESEDPSVSPLRPRHERVPARPSLAPDSGQVSHMKERFARLAEDLRHRDDEVRPARPLSTERAAAAAQAARQSRRQWTPPRPAPDEKPLLPGSPNLRSRSPSPLRGEMPNSPRGGGSGAVERPRPTPVSARKASWEEQIAAANTTVAGKSRTDKPPIFLRSPTVIKEKHNRTPEAAIMQQSDEEAVKKENAYRKESLRKNRERQTHLKYEAGLAAIGFDISPGRNEAQKSKSVGEERGVKRTNEEAFKRPSGSSLLRIISQSSGGEKMRVNSLSPFSQKKAKMLDFMAEGTSSKSAADPCALTPPEPQLPAPMESPDMESDECRSNLAYSDTNSLFPDDDETVMPPKLNTFMQDMWRAERRASICEESMTDVTPADILSQSDFDDVDENEEKSETADETEDKEFAVEDDEEIAGMEEHVKERSLIEEQVEERSAMEEEEELPSSEANSLPDVSPAAPVHDEETRLKFRRFLENRQESLREVVADQSQTPETSSLSDEGDVSSLSHIPSLPTFSPPAFVRDSGRGGRRRSSSLSDLRSPCLRRESSSRPVRAPAGLAYTVEGYRSTVQERQESPPAARVYAMDFGSDSEDGAGPGPGAGGPLARADAKRLLSLQQQAHQQEEVIYQATRALHQVVASGHTGSAQHVECCRVQTVACQKRRSLLEEAQRLRQGLGPAPAAAASACVLTLSGVRLVLRASYRQRIQQQQQALQAGAETVVEQHQFMGLLRLPGGRVHPTELTATGTNVGPCARDFVEIPSCLTVRDLPQGFVANLEIYGLSLSRMENRAGAATPSKESTPRRLLHRLTSRGPHGSTRTATGHTSGGWTAYSGFTLLSSVRLTADSVGQSVFPLVKLPGSCPLEGIVQLRLRVTNEPRIELRGFLSIFAEVGGFGSWLRRWCSLRRDWLLMWNYPDEEQSGSPALHAINLRQCFTRRVELLSREECARPNTVRLMLLRPAREGETDNLIVTRVGDSVREKCLLSAESRKEQVDWADNLNECLFLMRQCHPDQFRVLEARAQTLFSS